MAIASFSGYFLPQCPCLASRHLPPPLHHHPPPPTHTQAGYSRHVVLQPSELSALPLLLRARLAQSLALGAASVVADPGNAPYLLMTQG